MKTDRVKYIGFRKKVRQKLIHVDLVQIIRNL